MGSLNTAGLSLLSNRDHHPGFLQMSYHLHQVLIRTCPASFDDHQCQVFSSAPLMPPLTCPRVSQACDTLSRPSSTPNATERAPRFVPRAQAEAPRALGGLRAQPCTTTALPLPPHPGEHHKYPKGVTRPTYFASTRPALLRQSPCWRALSSRTRLARGHTCVIHLFLEPRTLYASTPRGTRREWHRALLPKHGDFRSLDCLLEYFHRPAY